MSVHPTSTTVFLSMSPPKGRRESSTAAAVYPYFIFKFSVWHKLKVVLKVTADGLVEFVFGKCSPQKNSVITLL